jgi:hypothetical protein
VVNIQWRRVIQHSKYGYFDNTLKSGSKTALNPHKRAKGFEKYSNQVEDWHLCCPHLNPCEYIWVDFKCRLQTRDPETQSTNGGPDIVNASLCNILPEIGEETTDTQFEKLWISIPD